jgi:hypothetical protein
MRRTVRQTALLTAALAGVLAATAGVAMASPAHGDDGSGSSHHPNGTGSGLSGGPTPAQVLPDGAAPVPLPDPTLGAGELLPPAYNGLAAATG